MVTSWPGSRNKYLVAIALLIYLSLLASACGRNTTVCPEGSITYFSGPATEPGLSSAADFTLDMTPVEVEIRGKMTEVDRVINGPICEDTWSGTIYVGCDIQIAQWQEVADFFVQCPLTIEPQTTIYVAAHNDTAYYKGCSCHSGELADY